jgi:hypothetical protein
LLDREDIQAPWKQYTEHDFVQRMGDGTLPLDNFRYYMIQDYLFLVQFARANALSAYKSSSLKDIGRSVQQVVTLQEEIKLHVEFCKEFGLEEEDIVGEEEDQGMLPISSRFAIDGVDVLCSNHRIHALCPRHRSISGLARAPSRAPALPHWVRYHCKTLVRGPGDCEGGQQVLGLD